MTDRTIRLTLIRKGLVLPPITEPQVGIVKCDVRAVQARQRDAGATRKALAILERAAQRPCANDSRGRRVVDARAIRAVAHVG